MSSPSRLPGSSITNNQREQLLVLHRAGAIDKATSIGPFSTAWKASGTSCMPVVLGALRGMGLALSRVTRTGPGGSQFTAYYLTPEGVTFAERLAAAHRTFKHDETAWVCRESVAKALFTWTCFQCGPVTIDRAAAAFNILPVTVCRLVSLRLKDAPLKIESDVLVPVSSMS